VQAIGRSAMVERNPSPFWTELRACREIDVEQTSIAFLHQEPIIENKVAIAP
jgi:hypothetical protein